MLSSSRTKQPVENPHLRQARVLDPRRMKMFTLTSVAFLAFVKEAHAYVDPGTGSYVLQIVIAGVVAGLFAIKTFWFSIVTFFSNLFGKRPRNRRDDG